jgi:hypothetical protein
MPAKVIFDTGSEHLAVTSSFCNNKTAGKYRFELQSAFSKTIDLEYEEFEQKKIKIKSETILADNDVDSSYIGLS